MSNNTEEIDQSNTSTEKVDVKVELTDIQSEKGSTKPPAKPHIIDPTESISKELADELEQIAKKMPNQEAKEIFQSMPEGEKLKIKNVADELMKQSQMYAACVMHQLYWLTCKEDPELKKMLDKILPYDKIGYMGGTFTDTTDRPIFQLYIVEKNYKLNLYSPTKYVKTIYNALGFMLECARNYHIVMAQTNPKLINYMSKLRPDVDFSMLLSDDEKKETMYFDKNLEKRLGVSCIWVDKENKPIH